MFHPNASNVRRQYFLFVRLVVLFDLVGELVSDKDSV